MSDAIRLLERLGAAPVRGAAGADAIVAAAGEMPAAQRKALLDRDPDALRTLAGGRRSMRCLIISPEPGQTAPCDRHRAGSSWQG